MAAGLAITTLAPVTLSVLPERVKVVTVSGEPQETRRIVLFPNKTANAQHPIVYERGQRAAARSQPDRGDRCVAEHSRGPAGGDASLRRRARVRADGKRGTPPNKAEAASPTAVDLGEGPPVRVLDQDGSQRAAEYIGERETSAWFEGPPTAFVVCLDTRRGEAVEVERVIPRA